MKNKKILSIILSVVMLLGLMPGIAHADGELKAYIRGVDGSTENLRSSQLLEVVTEGFAPEATLKYTYDRSELYMGSSYSKQYPYVFAFDVKDMAIADEDTKSSSSKSIECYYKYFAISTRYSITDNNTVAHCMTDDDLKNITISVTVEDVNRDSASYGQKTTAEYTGFKEFDLSADMGEAIIVMFEGDTENVLDLLGKAGVTHITCANCEVGEAISADEDIARVTGDSNTHQIFAVRAGETFVELEVSKSAKCAFHSGSTGHSHTKLIVLKKPVPSVDDNSITLTNLEEGVSYTIGDVTQICEDPSKPLVFEGLNSGEDYTIYVETKYDTDEGTKTAYTFTDVGTLTEAEPYEPSSLFKSNYAYIFGYDNITMGAENNVLRSEAAQMIYRLVKQNNALGGFVYSQENTPVFNDSVDEWFRSGIEYMNYKGALTADENGNAYPYVQITRGEAFKFICLGLSLTAKTNLTRDAYAKVLVDAGYVEGDEYGNLNLYNPLTRAEFCAIYNRIIGRSNKTTANKNAAEPVKLLTKAGKTAEELGYIKIFADLMAKSDAWYYYEMIKATSAFTNDGYIDEAGRGIRNDLDDYTAPVPSEEPAPSEAPMPSEEPAPSEAPVPSED